MNIKKIIICLLLLPVVLVSAAWGLSYLMKQRDIHAAAGSLKLLERGPVKQGEGGDAMFLLLYDVPDAATRREWLTRYGSNALLRDSEALHEHVAAAKLKQPQANNLNCIAKQPDGQNPQTSCLKNVRANLPAYRQAVQQNAKLLTNADALSQYDNLNYLIHDFANDALPPLQLIVNQDTPAAVDWVENRHQAALARVCRNIKTGRTLMSSQGSLLDVMIGNTTVGRNTTLLAHMLAEQPDFASKLPENCTSALSPFPQGEPNSCEAIKTEFHFQKMLIQNMHTDMASTLAKVADKQPLWAKPSSNNALWYSPEHTIALFATHMAQVCTDDAHLARIQDNRPVIPNAYPTAEKLSDYITRPACWSNSIGCIVQNVGMPNHTVYAERLQDTAMQQRALLAALSVYRLPPEQRLTNLDSILAQHASPSRQLAYNETTGKITFTRYSQNENNPAIDIPLNLP